MPNIQSPLGTPIDAMPLVNQTELGKAAGLMIFFPTLAALNSAITKERANIVAQSALYSDGQPFMVSGEVGTRRWSASAKHARNVTLPGGRIITLAADSNMTFAVTGAPASGLGAIGDVAVDQSAGGYYVKASAGWPATGVSFVAAGTQLIAAGTVIPLAQRTIMAPQTVSSALALTVDLTGASAFISFFGTFYSDGVSGHVPVISGAVAHSDDKGYANGSAGIENILTVFVAGSGRAMYAWSQDAAHVATGAGSDSVAPTITAIAVTNAQPGRIALTFSEAMSQVAGNTPPAADFSVAGGTHVPTAWTWVDASHAYLTVPTVVYGESLTLSYAPTSNRLKDLASNNLAAFSGAAISNGTLAVPGAPTIGTATAGNAQAQVAFNAPASNGGSPITGYTVTATPGGATGTGSASPIVVTSLTNGTSYTFKAKATNAIGTGPDSAASNSCTPTAGGGSSWNLASEQTEVSSSAVNCANATAPRNAVKTTNDSFSGDVQITARVRFNQGTTYTGVPDACEIGIFSRGSSVSPNTWPQNQSMIGVIGMGGTDQVGYIGHFLSGSGSTTATTSGAPALAANTNYDVTFTTKGSAVSMKVQRVSDGFWLQANGSFASGTYTLTATDTTITGTGQWGFYSYLLGRSGDGYNTDWTVSITNFAIAAAP